MENKIEITLKRFLKGHPEWKHNHISGLLTITKSLEWDIYDLFNNGYLSKLLFCKAITETKGGDFRYKLDRINLENFCEDKFGVSLDDFLLENIKKLIELKLEKSQNKDSINDKTEIEKGKFLTTESFINSHIMGVGNNICLFFVNKYGMNEFIRRFSNFYDFSFLKTINILSNPTLFNNECEYWGRRDLDNILIEYIHHHKLSDVFLLNTIEFNFIPDAQFNYKIYNKIKSQEHNPKIFLSTTKADLSHIGDVSLNHRLCNITHKNCIITSSWTNHYIHICFYNIESSEDFFDVMTLANVENKNWDTFIHLNDEILTLDNENQNDGLKYPNFYQVLLGNRFKFKKLVSNILSYDDGIDHYAITNSTSHKEWVLNFPFKSEENRSKFKRLDLDTNFNDYFRSFVDSNERNNTEVDTVLQFFLINDN